MTIRRACEADVEVIAQNNHAMAKESEGLELSMDTLRLGSEAVLKDPAKGVFFLLEVEGKVVSQLMITYEWSDWRNAQIWWVQSVYTLPSHRRQGHYRRLYQHVRDLCKAEGAGGIRLYADASNVRAHATYEALGMSSHYKVFEEEFIRL
ncbi:hypothetical protein WJX72_011112 [[Myrmecia] bisecta]|uniref:N-acetyltransferase domain-containing protein n=1 Tax=[Myrmecia] bisecta TaxID=41462 RepID=A0AAW1PV93_9CHLO